MKIRNHCVVHVRKNYVVTVISTPCTVTAVLDDGGRVILLEAGEPGQHAFVAISNGVEVDQNDAIVTPVFKGAPIGRSGGGGVMRDVIIPIMPDDGVVLSAGINMIVASLTSNLYIKSVGSGAGESRLFFTVADGGVLNVIAPVALKWLNGNKTHYVNAGDTVAVSVCNGLITVGTYS